VEQEQGATLLPAADVTDVRGLSQRVTPWRWSRRVSPVSLPSPTPNEGMEPTAYSVRYASASGSGSCPAFGYSIENAHSETEHEHPH
jgi:hypothetical protein